MYSNEQALKTGNFEWQERKMDAIISAMESNLIGFKWARLHVTIVLS